MSTADAGSGDYVPGALDGLIVLDMSRVLAGPYASMLLGDFGARVIKIEQPGQGDETRMWGPPFTEAGQSAYFIAANRNKESVTINLKAEAGRQIILDLARRADILIENFRAGSMGAWGLGYDVLAIQNPRLIYCSITGYGQSGPYRDRPGYDVAVQAQAGLMSITGPAEDETGEAVPYKVGVAVVDVTAGLYAVLSILAALHHRSRSGNGQYIDIALYDTQLSWLVNVASSYLISGKSPQRYGNAHPSIVPYQTFRTSDSWLMVAVGNDGQFTRLCRVLESPGLAEDVRFQHNQSRVENRTLLIPILDAMFRLHSTSEWAEKLQAVGVPCSPVNDIPTALADPHTIARNMVQHLRHPVVGDVPIIGPAPKLSRTPARARSAPPLVGEHTESILVDYLGYTTDQLQVIRAANAI
jgi:crotonobetainyl-CoA:carnitine CoA-transferase CaiB-like acyl-CoA transferase